MIPRRRVLGPLPAAVLGFCIAAGAARGDDGFRLLEATAASVNGEIVFLSDVVREACFYRCAAFPGDDPREMSPAQARDKLVADALVLQEQKKLGLWTVDDAAVEGSSVATGARLAECADPCAREVGPDAVRAFTARRLSVREFLDKRVSVLVEVNDEDVRMEIRRRAAREGADPDSLKPDRVKRELFEEEAAREIRNWFERATSKSRIFLSPLEGR